MRTKKHRADQGTGDDSDGSSRRYPRPVTSPIRRRIAATLTCIVLVFATFGYMQRSASEASHDAPQGQCEDVKRGQVLECLNLYDD